MKTDILDTAVALSDHDLLARINALAGMERETTAELVAHLAALELRPSLYAARGYGSLFGYCTQALHLSEDAACNRINAARACRRFPVILDLLASGDLSLTSVRKLQPHLTPENHRAVLARAKNGTKEEIEALVAALAPRPDVAASMRKLPAPKATSPTPHPAATQVAAPCSTDPPSAPVFRPASHPIVQTSAPERYRVQFTIDQDTHAKLRRVQALLRREIPNGDPAAIYNRGLDLLLEKAEKAKLGAVGKPRGRAAGSRPTNRAHETRIRFGTDKGTSVNSRHIPNDVKGAVWRRDSGRCAFVSKTGRRCSESTFLEFHHIQPYAMEGSATMANISLRCRRHNQYEAELVFGPRDAGSVGEARESYRCVTGMG